MKNRLLRKLSALLLILAFAFSITGCTPEIHIHTGDESSEEATVSAENSTIASTKEKTSESNETKTDVDTSIVSSETQKGNSGSAAQSKSDSTVSKSASSKASTASQISKSKAKSIALKDAGLNAADIYDYEIELDRDDGVVHYDISFESGGEDYDYDINAATGEIISVDKPKATSSEVKISKSTAKNTALNHAGVKSADISLYQIELEKDDGIWKYEISFNKGNVEYDYTINAVTGKIIESEKDIDD